MRWNYKAELKDIQHVGPFAEDFFEAFHLNGSQRTMIAETDRSGIALAGVKGLIAEVNHLKAANDNLEAKQEADSKAIEELRHEVKALKAAVNR